MKLESTFEDQSDIGKRHTCDGEDISPPLSISGVPEGAKSLALIVDDPDAPMGTWVHWVVYNIEPSTMEIGEGEVPGSQGLNDFGKKSYGGPCPPSGRHRYYFKLYALDKRVDDGAQSGKQYLEKEMEGHIMSQTQLMGYYSRS